MKRVFLVSAMLIMFSTLAQAESLRWDQVSLYYLSTDVTTRGGEKATGFGFQAMKSLGDKVFAFGNFERTNDYYAEYIATSFGVGYRHYIANDTALWVSVSNVDVEIDSNRSFSFRTEKVDGYALQTGIRSQVAIDLEVSGSLSYLETDEDSQSAIGASVRYFFTENFSGAIGIDRAEDSTTKAFSLSYFF